MTHETLKQAIDDGIVTLKELIIWNQQHKGIMR